MIPSGSPDNSLSGWRSEAEPQEAADDGRLISDGLLCLDRSFDLVTRTTSCPGYPIFERSSCQNRFLFPTLAA